MRVLLISNEASGSGRGGGQVRTLLEEAGGDVEEVPVQRLGSPDDPAVADVDPGDARRVVVAGGDGSIGPAGALAVHAGLPLAVVPTGTANDFARAHGIPLDVEQACAVAVGADVEVADAELGLAGRRPFVNAASVGLSPAAARRAHRLKRRLGRLSYMAGAMQAGLRMHPVACRVTCDGDEAFSGTAWQVTVAVTGAFGGGSATGGTQPQDARLDVAVVPAGPRLGLARRAWGMRTRRLVEQDGVVHARAAVVDLDVEESSPFNVDGEVCNPRTRFSLHPRPLRVVMPG